MADDKSGTSADTEVPLEENENVSENETPAEDKTTDAVEEAVAEAPAEVEESPAGAEVSAEAADEPAEELVAEATAAEAPSEGAPSGEEVRGTSAEAEVPAKRKKKRLPRSQRPQRTRPTRVKAVERKPIVRLEKPEHERGRRQERQGTVVSDAMEKTIVVKVEVVKAHPRYKKVVRRSVKFHAHDEQSTAKVGDIVRIVETRPLSKTKRWRLAEVVEAAK